MKTIGIETHLRQVAARKAMLRAAGVEVPDDAALRNSGRRRTPEKRELLRRADQRAAEAGLAPIRQDY